MHSPLPAPPVHPGLPMPRRLVAIAASCFGTALFVLDGALPNVALPTIARDLRVGQGMVVNVVTVYQLVLVMGLLPFASLGDRFGHRRVYQAGQMLFLLASAAALLVQSFAGLLALRAVQGLGASLAMSVGTAQIRSIWPSKRLGMGLAVNAVVVTASNSLAPVLGGLLAGRFDWRWVFAVAAPLAVVSLLLGRALPDPQPRPARFDWRSALALAGGLALLLGGLELGVHGGRAGIGATISLAGLLVLTRLVRHERRQARPVLPVDLIARPVIGLSLLGSVAGFIASSSLIVGLPFRLEHLYGFSAAQVGQLILPFPLTLVVVAPVAGLLSDRVPAAWMGVTGMAIVVAGLGAFIALPAQPDGFQIGWRLSLCALGFGLFLPPNGRTLLGAAPIERSAAAGGLMATGRLFGQTLGAVLVGVLLSLGLGTGPAPMITGMVLATLAALCSLARHRATGGQRRK